MAHVTKPRDVVPHEKKVVWHHKDYQEDGAYDYHEGPCEWVVSFHPGPHSSQHGDHWANEE
jgi:hypothetical protein